MSTRNGDFKHGEVLVSSCPRSMSHRSFLKPGAGRRGVKADGQRGPEGTLGGGGRKLQGTVYPSAPRSKPVLPFLPGHVGRGGSAFLGLIPGSWACLAGGGWDTDPILPPEKTPTESRQVIRWILLALHRDSKKIEPTFLNYATSQ